MTHTFFVRGKHFIFDSESGALHKGDALIAEIVAEITPPMSEICPPEMIELYGNDGTEIWAELYALQQDGQLFTPETLAVMENPGVIKAICLHVAHDCNLRCEYCFAGTGDFGQSRGLMDVETGRQAVDFLLAHAGNRRHLEIDFFGGEPLMAWETVVATVAYAKRQAAAHDKVIRLTLTTNGLLLDDMKIDYINTEIDNVVLSLDGRVGVHDALRKTVSGENSHALVLEKFQKLVAQREKSYYVRGTFTVKNLDFSQDVLALREMGFRHVSIEPVVLSATHELAILPRHIPEIEAEYEKLLDILVKRPDINFFHFNVNLDSGPCAYKRAKGCGAGVEYVAITPEGDIFPCHQFVGQSEYKLGSLHHGIQGNKHDFASHNLYTRALCATCWARYLCGGGCPAANLTENGNIETPYEIGCRLACKRFECALSRL